jgi:hypothetical protein
MHATESSLLDRSKEGTRSSDLDPHVERVLRRCDMDLDRPDPEERESRKLSLTRAIVSEKDDVRVQCMHYLRLPGRPHHLLLDIAPSIHTSSLSLSCHVHSVTATTEIYFFPSSSTRR